MKVGYARVSTQDQKLLDRLGWSLRHLIDLVARFRESDVDFVSLSDNIDTTTAQGRLIFNIFASFAEFERELISERTKAGLKAAREKGRIGGRKPGLSDEAKTKAWAAHHLAQQEELSAADIINQLGVSKATYYRYLDWAKNNLDEKPIRKRRIKN